MSTIKQKGYKLINPVNSEAITSVIVPYREKNRPPQLALQEFAKRTITLFLFPNVFCPISELQKTMAYIIKIWRRIINNDIRYQQKQDNLPSFLGVRDTCVKFSAPELLTDADKIPSSNDYDQIVYPYLRVTIDNCQVAAFILMKWCAHTGQNPHRFEWIALDKKRPYTDFRDFNMCSPLYIETLLQNDNIKTVQFGKAGKITTENVNRNTDLYNVPQIRVSQKFGTRLTVYSTRKLQRLQEARKTGEFERIRRYTGKSKAIDAIRYRRAQEVEKYTATYQMGLFNWRKYGGDTNWYRARREHVVTRVDYFSAEECDKAIAKIEAPELLKENFPNLSGVVLDDFKKLEDVALSALKIARNAEEDMQMLREEIEKNNVRIKDYKYFRSKKGVKNHITNYFSMAFPKIDRVKDFDIEDSTLRDAIDIIANFFEIDVDYRKNEIHLK